VGIADRLWGGGPESSRTPPQAKQKNELTADAAERVAETTAMAAAAGLVMGGAVIQAALVVFLWENTN
jgi:hypothetical protein